MTDFKAAFLKGQEAAIQTIRARESINQVIASVSSQVMEATNNCIFIDLHDHTFAKPVKNFFMSISLLNREWETATHVSAKLATLDDSKYVPLARWSQSDEGYPCTITFGSHVLTCHDSVALEAAFGKMLANPGVGEKLADLLKQASESKAADDSVEQT
jgi:hypothetical protein